jgi:hypothetical protein
MTKTKKSKKFLFHSLSLAYPFRYTGSKNLENPRDGKSHTWVPLRLDLCRRGRWWWRRRRSDS